MMRIWSKISSRFERERIAGQSCHTLPLINRCFPDTTAAPLTPPQKPPRIYTKIPERRRDTRGGGRHGKQHRSLIDGGDHRAVPGAMGAGGRDGMGSGGPTNSGHCTCGQCGAWGVTGTVTPVSSRSDGQNVPVLYGGSHSPRSDGAPVRPRADYLSCRRGAGGVLLVPCLLHGAYRYWFLADTGAARTLSPRRSLPTWRCPRRPPAGSCGSHPSTRSSWHRSSRWPASRWAPRS